MARRWSVLLLATLLAGCSSPEDGRSRGDSQGADGGNYIEKPVHVPGKIDGTRSLSGTPR